MDEEPEFWAAVVGAGALVIAATALLFAALGYGGVLVTVSAIAAVVWIGAGIRFVRLRLPVLNAVKTSRLRSLGRAIRAWIEYAIYFISP